MRTFLLAYGLGLVALILTTPTFADESKMVCHTITVQQCDSTPQGRLYNCRDVKSERCTVVSGPGSGKATLETTDTTTPPKKQCSLLQTVIGCYERK